MHFDTAASTFTGMLALRFRLTPNRIRKITKRQTSATAIQKASPWYWPLKRPCELLLITSTSPTTRYRKASTGRRKSSMTFRIKSDSIRKSKGTGLNAPKRPKGKLAASEKKATGLA